MTDWKPLTEKPEKQGQVLMCDLVCREITIGWYDLFEDGSGEFVHPAACIDRDRLERFRWAEMPEFPE